MSLKNKKFRLFLVALLTSIVTVIFIDNSLSANEQSLNTSATSKLKVLSESMNASDIVKIRKLIDAGADVNIINKIGNTPLSAALFMDETDIVKLLLEAGADVNKAGKDGFPPLSAASYNGHTEIVKLLLETGADANKANKNGDTPLSAALYKGQTEIVRLLKYMAPNTNYFAIF